MIKYKNFLTFEEQLDHLVNKRNFHISDRNKLNLYLKNYNYQNFINGYKDPFMKGFRRENNTYLDEIDEKCIISLFNFDKMLASQILFFIQNIERKFNTSLCYVIAKEMKNINYINGNILEIKNDDFSKIFEAKNSENIESIKQYLLDKILEQRNSEIIKKYKNNFDKTPIWTISLILSFGDVLKLFGKLKSNIKEEIYKLLFDDKFEDPKTFESIMLFLKNIRNRCCHNNVVYKINTSKNSKLIASFLIKNKLNTSKSNKSNKIRIFDAIKIIDYLLDDEINFFNLKKIIENYLDEYILNNEYIPEISKNEICRIMNYEKN